MDRKIAALLTLAILDLSFSYLLFTGQQYFSMLAMVLLLLLAFIAGVIFVGAYSLRLEENRLRCMLALALPSMLIIIYEVLFLTVPSGGEAAILRVSALILGGVIVSVIGLYATGRLAKRLEAPGRYAVALMFLIITALAAYFIMYGIVKANWNGVDELSFNYYAASLFVKGINPYSVGMLPILRQSHVYPTVLLNGSYEDMYDYPALSFISIAFIPLLGITSYYSFIGITIFLALLSAFLVYEDSGLNREALLLIAIWLGVTYVLVGTVSHYLSVAVFLLMAYLLRRRYIASGILLGLAASTIQLSWFAAPFFYALAFRKHGKKALYTELGASIIVFLLINAYFIATYPATLSHLIGFMGTNQLVFYGTNIMQFIATFYQAQFWYPALLAVTVLIACLALFYLYNESLYPLIAVAPALIFFLTWRNITIYALPFMPLIISIYYGKGPKGDRNLAKDAKPAIYMFAGIVVIAVIIGVYAHYAYLSQKPHLSVGGITPIVYITPDPSSLGYHFSLRGLAIRLTYYNTSNPASFYVVSRKPDGKGYFWTPVPQGAPNGNTYNYTLDYRQGQVQNGTEVIVFGFNRDYIATNELGFNLQLPQGLPH